MTKSTAAVNRNDGTPDDSLPSRYRWVIVGVLWLIHAVVFMNMSSLGILAPFIKEDLQLSSFQIGLLDFGVVHRDFSHPDFRWG